MTKFALGLATVFVFLLTLLAPTAAEAAGCSDGNCHAIAHKLPDDGYDDPIPVLCGTNLIRYNIAEGQSSEALGCNDVNRIGAKPGHATKCYLNGSWTIVAAQNDTYTSIKWSSGYLGSVGAGTTYLCVDALYDTSGGGGGGGGGGGTW